MQVNARFTFDKVVFNQDNDLHLVISLVAPSVPVTETRRPILVMPVLDISGSMSGQKLEFAKQSILKLIDHLQSTDFCGLVTFESEVQLVSGIVPMSASNKEQLKAKVKALDVRGSTAFAGGMLLGLEQVNQSDVPAETLIRVIMFTDGQANVGPRGREILTLVDPNLKRASLSAFGYGSDADQELLADLSNRANGNYAFIKNVDDAPAAFARELGGLISTYAQNIRVEITTKENNKITKVLSDVKQLTEKPEEGRVTILSLPEVLSEETSNLVLAFKSLRISQAESLFETLKNEVVNVKVTFDTIVNGVKQTNEIQTGATLEFVNPGNQQTKATTEVDALVAIAQMTQAQAEAEKLATAGQYNEAFTVMNSISNDILTRGHDTISGTASKLGSKMRSRTEYAASAGYRRSAYAGGTKGMKLSLGDAEAEADLESIGVTTSNSFQADLVSSFNDTAAPATVPDKK